MRKIRVRERTATLEELADDRRRCLAAKSKQPAPAPAQKGNLVAVLVLFARWRRCCCCSGPLLFVGADCRATGDVECPTCQGIRENLAERLKPSLPMRAALHLLGLFSMAIDNREVAHAS